MPWLMPRNRKAPAAETRRAVRHPVANCGVRFRGVRRAAKRSQDWPPRVAFLTAPKGQRTKPFSRKAFVTYALAVDSNRFDSRYKTKPGIPARSARRSQSPSGWAARQPVTKRSQGQTAAKVADRSQVNVKELRGDAASRICHEVITRGNIPDSTDSPQGNGINTLGVA